MGPPLMIDTLDTLTPLRVMVNTVVDMINTSVYSVLMFLPTVQLSNKIYFSSILVIKNYDGCADALLAIYT